MNFFFKLACVLTPHVIGMVCVALNENRGISHMTHYFDPHFVV